MPRKLVFGLVIFLVYSLLWIHPHSVLAYKVQRIRQLHNQMSNLPDWLKSELETLGFNLPQDTNPSSSPDAAFSLTDIQTYLINRVNDYRISQSLTSVKADPYTCDFAKIRASEIAVNFNHDGFNQRATNHTMPYPSYSLLTENIALNPDYQNVVASWVNSPGHAANMRSDTTYVCVAKNGNYYAYEGWKP